MTSSAPTYILDAIERRGVARDGAVQGHVIAYLDQPSVTIELASGEQRTVALSVFTRDWQVDPEPSEHAKDLVEESLRRNSNAHGRVAAHEILEFARTVALEAVARVEQEHA